MKKWPLLSRSTAAISIFMIYLILSSPYLASGQDKGEDTGGLFGFPLTPTLEIGSMNLGGSHFQNVSAGLEIELSAYTSLSPHTTVGGGLSASSPELSLGRASGSLSLFGVFAEVRYYPWTRDHGVVQPFVGAQLGAIHQNKKISTPTSFQRTRIWGEEVEGQAGFKIPLISNIILNLKGGLGLVYFGQSNDVVIQNGQFQSVNRDPSLGTTYTLKVGLSYRTH